MLDDDKSELEKKNEYFRQNVLFRTIINISFKDNINELEHQKDKILYLIFDLDNGASIEIALNDYCKYVLIYKGKNEKS